MSKLDFSEFHPLDHSIFDPYCWGWYGGIKQHIILWWHYQLDLDAKIHRTFFCARGKHTKTPYWKGRRFGENVPPTGYMCTYCEKELIPNAEELAAKQAYVDGLIEAAKNANKD
jgi:hypothetical protein